MMAEVIDLLSSSPPRPKEEHLGTSGSRQSGWTTEVFTFGSDDDLAPEDFDSGLERPFKKQKIMTISGPSRVTKNQPSRLKPDSCFQLSSDIDSSFGVESMKGLIASSKAISSLTFDDNNDDWDIRFSSSAPEPVRKSLPKVDTAWELYSDIDALNDPIQTSSPSAEASSHIFSQRTTNLLVNIRATTSKSIPAAKSQKSTNRWKRAISIDQYQPGVSGKVSNRNLDDTIDSSQQESVHSQTHNLKQPVTRGKLSKPSAASKSKVAKQSENEIERERKRQAKEVQALAKQQAAEIAEANKSKTNKKNSTSEMSIDLPDSLRNTALANQLEENLKDLQVDLTYVTSIGEAVLTANNLPATHVIRWRRKVTAEYDEDQEIWYPLPEPRLSFEEHIMVYLKAEDFVRIAVVDDDTGFSTSVNVAEDSMKSNLDRHVANLRKQYPKGKIVYLIEGLNTWLRKSFNAKNRAYTAAVRAQHANTEPDAENSERDMVTASQEIPTTTQTRRKTGVNHRKKAVPKTSEIDLSSITEATTEALLIHLQLHHQPLLIHHTTSAKTSAIQISIFTQQLSTRPYRLAAQSANLSSASFCMTTGQIRTGSNSDETWIQMLQEINRVTPSMAYGISAAGYTNPVELVRAFGIQGKLMLEDVRKSVNKDGAWSDRRLGPMVSKRIYKVFTGRDPQARDGIA